MSRRPPQAPFDDRSEASLKAGCAPAYRHREQEEAHVVISGSGQVRLDDEIRELRCWDVVRVNPATVRAFEAGDDGLELIAIGSDRPDGGDGVFVDPAWID